MKTPDIIIASVFGTIFVGLLCFIVFGGYWAETGKFLPAIAARAVWRWLKSHAKVLSFVVALGADAWLMPFGFNVLPFWVAFPLIAVVSGWTTQCILSFFFPEHPIFRRGPRVAHSVTLNKPGPGPGPSPLPTPAPGRVDIAELEALIIGYRGFKLGAGPRLTGMYREDVFWDRTMTAHCSGSEKTAFKHLSGLGSCSEPGCGIYAYRTTERLFTYEAGNTLVWGAVRLEGNILLYTEGYRAEKATIERLWVDRRALRPEFDLVEHLKNLYGCPVEVATWGQFTEDRPPGDDPAVPASDPRGSATWLKLFDPPGKRQAPTPPRGGTSMGPSQVRNSRAGMYSWYDDPDPPVMWLNPHRPSCVCFACTQKRSAPQPVSGRQFASFHPAVRNYSPHYDYKPDGTAEVEADLKLGFMIPLGGSAPYAEINAIVDDIVKRGAPPADLALPDLTKQAKLDAPLLGPRKDRCEWIEAPRGGPAPGSCAGGCDCPANREVPDVELAF